jgi:acyl carrier protein
MVIKVTSGPPSPKEREEVIIKAAWRNCASGTDVKLTFHLYDDLGFDDLDLVEFIMEVEDEFRIDIDDRTMEKFATLQDVLDEVNRLLLPYERQ